MKIPPKAQFYKDFRRFASFLFQKKTRPAGFRTNGCRRSPSCKATALAERSSAFAAYAAGVCAKLNRAFRTDLTNTPGGYII